jgi:hypothetical protein
VDALPDLARLEGELARLTAEEHALRQDLARARRDLNLERAATRPVPMRVGPEVVGIMSFLVSLLVTLVVTGLCG